MIGVVVLLIVPSFAKNVQFVRKNLAFFYFSQKTISSHLLNPIALLVITAQCMYCSCKNKCSLLC